MLTSFPLPVIRASESFNLNDQSPRNHDLANISAGRGICSEDVLLGVDQQNVEELICTDECTDEGAVVASDDAEGLMEEVPHSGDRWSVWRRHTVTCHSMSPNEPVSKCPLVEHARPVQLLQHPQVLRHLADLQRAQEPPYHHLVVGQGVPRAVRVVSG